MVTSQIKMSCAKFYIQSSMHVAAVILLLLIVFLVLSVTKVLSFVNNAIGFTGSFL